MNVDRDITTPPTHHRAHPSGDVYQPYVIDTSFLKVFHE
jgi:hypothetical protein